MQTLTLKNSLSAEVNLQFKTSEVLEVEPENLKMAPFENCTVELTLKLKRAMPAKTVKQKEIVMIKSDFFDQKIVVWVTPGDEKDSSRKRETSLPNK